MSVISMPHPNPLLDLADKLFMGKGLFKKSALTIRIGSRQLVAKSTEKVEEIRVMTLTLLWKPISDQVLFILAVTSKGPIILMSFRFNANGCFKLSSCIVQEPVLKSCFSALKHLLGAFKFRFPGRRAYPGNSRRPFLQSPTQGNPTQTSQHR